MEEPGECIGVFFKHMSDSSMIQSWVHAGIQDTQLWVDMLRNRTVQELKGDLNLNSPQIWALECAIGCSLGDVGFKFGQQCLAPSSAGKVYQEQTPAAIPTLASAVGRSSVPKTHDFRQLHVEGVVSREECFTAGIWQLSFEVSSFLAALSEVGCLMSSSPYKICQIIVWDSARWTGYYHGKQHVRNLLTIIRTCAPEVEKAAGGFDKLASSLALAARTITKTVGASREGAIITRQDDVHPEYCKAWLDKGIQVPVRAIRDFIHGQCPGAFPKQDAVKLGALYDAILSGEKFPKPKQRCDTAMELGCSKEVDWVFRSLQWPKEADANSSGNAATISEKSGTAYTALRDIS